MAWTKFHILFGLIQHSIKGKDRKAILNRISALG
uniref:Uncharacterized protein n=1 Tax=Rhizophora mucronata TaxID=61149 RepID=A0A2P2PEQ6_RHIMU